MGKFGTGSFDNDYAYDLYLGFLKSPKKEKLKFYLEQPRILADSGFAEMAVAAAEIMALYKERADKNIDLGELGEAFKDHPLYLQKSDYIFAANLLKEILAESSLKEGWKTVYYDGYEEWQKNVTVLIERLETF